MIALNAYIIAARRSAIGRVGGLHRHRRIADLAAPILSAALADAKVAPGDVELLVLGNTSAGDNPARLVALVAGLSDQISALSVDRGEASGLEAALLCARSISTGEVAIAAAGGAEALSMAPWRLARPRLLHQMPRILGSQQGSDDEPGASAAIEGSNQLAEQLGISRTQQDEFALAHHIKAGMARDDRKFAKEIVALRSRADEARDELISDIDMDELEGLPALLSNGTATAGNVSPIADGAAFVVMVSQAVYDDLGRPPALRLVAAMSVGLASRDEIRAPIVATERLMRRLGTTDANQLCHSIELGELSAAQALAFQTALGIEAGRVNSRGGQIARGRPQGAASSVLAVRLFSELVRAPDTAPGARGLAVTGAAGGQAVAVLFERV